MTAQPDADAVMAGTPARPPRSRKSSRAFRTISEVAVELDVAAHVLRFWETKFSQLRPVQRARGHRCYRPEDVALLYRIRSLLYAQGYTVRGVQRVLDGDARLQASETPAALPKIDDSRHHELSAVFDDLRDAIESLRLVLRKS